MWLFIDTLGLKAELLFFSSILLLNSPVATKKTQLILSQSETYYLYPNPVIQLVISRPDLLTYYQLMFQLLCFWLDQNSIVFEMD